MKRYMILDNESTRDFAEGLIGMICKGEKQQKYIKLFTCNGELLFDKSEVEEV